MPLSDTLTLKLELPPTSPQAGEGWIWTLHREDPRLPEPIPLCWRWMPSGSFRMGSRGYFDDEEPEFEVLVPEGFWMLESPVTQGQWLAVQGGENPSLFQSGSVWFNHPVERVSWHQAREWCATLQEYFKQKRKEEDFLMVRLPTEAEWEYSCRAGSIGEYANGDGPECLDEMGWFVDNSNGTTHPVKQKKPNAWNLFDMHGNVFEWCLDAWSDYHHREDNALVRECLESTEQDPLRVVRGGFFGNPAVRCRSAYRFGGQADHEDSGNGFRACLCLGPIKKSKP